MLEFVTKEQALTALAQHFDDFLHISELLDPSHPNPAVRLDGEFSSRNRYFGAAVAAVTGALSTTRKAPVTFSNEVLVALMEYTSYYEVMIQLMKAGTGIRIHPEPDEYGLPQLIGDIEQIRKTLERQRDTASLSGPFHVSGQAQNVVGRNAVIVAKRDEMIDG